MEDHEITYDLILNYLVNNNITFRNSLNIQSDILKSNYKYKDYFPYKKTGVNNKNNMSLISSILYLLENDYKLMPEEEQFKVNEIFLNQLKSKWNSLKKTNNYTKIEKEEGINIIINKEFDKLVPILSTVLMLNIIILDFENDTYSIESGADKINKYKNFIIIAKFKTEYEPVSNGEKKTFIIDDLNKNIVDFINNNSYINDELLKREGYKYNDTNNFKINLDEYNKTKLNKMKKEQLMNIIHILKLDVSEKETKNNIIEIILSQK